MTIPIASRPVSMRHLITLTDDRGIFEHAKGTQPRYAHGYCTDDNARLLVVAARDEGRSYASRNLGHIAMQFLVEAQCDDGAFRNRMSMERLWLDEACTHDCWGRALWAFGSSVSHNHDNQMRHKGQLGFDMGARHRASSPRSMAYAALGAAEILKVHPSHVDAIDLLHDAGGMLMALRSRAPWPWPESRLSYANAIIPEALIAAGFALKRSDMLDQGIGLLEWLVDHETRDGHLSVTPAGGSGPGDRKPAFDQQPIEVAAIADAAARAHRVTRDDKWRITVDRSIHWFLGHNDTGVSMIDPVTDGGYDGLEADGVNENEGAESTLSMVLTMQYAMTNGATGA